MKISKIISLSTVDVPNYPCQVVFSQGCNLDCKFCHNFPLIRDDPSCEIFNNGIIQNLNKNRLADAISFTGGEPLIQAGDLLEVIDGVNSNHISIDTNGLFPEELRNILEKSQKVFRVALDLKTSFSKYPELCGLSNSRHNEGYYRSRIIKSINVVQEANRILDLRTTYSPDYCKKEDLKEILLLLKDLNFKGNYKIQPFRQIGVREQYKFTEPNMADIVKISNEIRIEIGCEIHFSILN